MRTRRFEAPPFVVWRIEDTAGQSHYRLVPHAVLRALMTQSLVQWVGICSPIAVSAINLGISYFSGALFALLALPMYVIFAIYTNTVILKSLNSRPIQPIESLFSLCPSSARKVCDSSFPSIATARHNRLAITLDTLRYFLRSVWPRYIIRPTSQDSVNFARLEALTLRREDSCLHAFSAFAAVTFFVPQERRLAEIPAVEIRFILSYFSPLGFGFALCVVTFCCHPLLSMEYHISRLPFMLCVFLWFIQGALYLFFTLRQDFASLFSNYFGSQRFPKSMTQFANRQMERAPNLVDAVHTWVPWAIAIVMFGLASLYAGFLHSLE
jgi:hypothetical protein